VTGAVIVFHDVGVARAMSLRMSHLAQHDPLTGLPNRLLLNDRLNQAIEMARRHRQSLAVLYVDVDRFKHINDSLGHTVGDRSRSHVGWWPACAARTPSAGQAVTSSWSCFRK
jgi:GGDEF domain-containing protein